MGLLSELLLLPVTGPLRGLQFILEQILAEAEATYLDERRVEGELANLSLRHDLGQITGEEYDAQETALLEELDAIREYKEALLEQYAAEQVAFEDPEQYAAEQAAFEDLGEYAAGHDAIADLQPHGEAWE